MVAQKCQLDSRVNAGVVCLMIFKLNDLDPVSQYYNISSLWSKSLVQSLKQIIYSVFERPHSQAKTVKHTRVRMTAIVLSSNV